MRQDRQQPRGNTWKELYLAALFEPDKASIPKKIAEAQRAITIRRSELLNVPESDIEERQALDNALFFLQALRSCIPAPASAAA